MQKSLKSSVIASCCPIESWSKPRQISGLGRRAHSVSMSCCPIEVRKFKESESIPDNASNDSEQAGKTVRPLTSEGDEAKQHIKQQGFDAPAASIQIADARSSPFEVVGQENHGGPFAVDLDPGFDSAQALGILPTGLVSDQSDLVIADDIAFRSFQAFSVNTVAEVVFGSGDPKYAACGKIKEIGKVNVSLVENGDFTGLKPGFRDWRCPRTLQNSSSIMSLLRCLLACESVLRLGATAPRIAPSLGPWWRRLSHTSFSPIA